MSGDRLPSWRETPARQAIVEFVAAVTDPGSAEFVPEPERIAVFDNDGTLWTEQPMYAQLAFALDRAAELGHPASLERLHAGGMPALVELVTLTHAGLTTEEFEEVCRAWLASARHRGDPRRRRTPLDRHRHGRRLVGDLPPGAVADPTKIAAGARAR